MQCFFSSGRWVDKHTELTAELVKLGKFSYCLHCYCVASKICKELVEKASV